MNQRLRFKLSSSASFIVKQELTESDKPFFTRFADPFDLQSKFVIKLLRDMLAAVVAFEVAVTLTTDCSKFGT